MTNSVEIVISFFMRVAHSCSHLKCKSQDSEECLGLGTCVHAHRFCLVNLFSAEYSYEELTVNAVRENGEPSKSQDIRVMDRIAGCENAGHDTEGPNKRT